MQKSELAEGKNYAIRASPRDRQCRLAKVRYVGPTKAGKARVRHVEGALDALEEWVSTRTIMCRWADRKSFLRDEQHEHQLREASEQARDFVVESAISGVMEASGDSTGFNRTWSDDPDRIRRMWRRAGLETDPFKEPYGYVDRHGVAHLSYESALVWAIAFTATEPEPVLTWLEE